ncbi:hypothetical protein EDD18DRAFT_1104576 [Armillaria luteobubalina]|uniref:Nucleoplasmin-like domain-containing protein n=1 Tax=Armillaria luteobubalina TaxID=153913 RepID=A0AA39Q8H1_9AGAR|nr:hypothetical protein EDD18DRAFT_1104576 [Armillaria luteobubalina]
MSTPLLLVNFGSWERSEEIPPMSSLSLEVGKDSKVISNAALASWDHEERSTLSIYFKKRGDEQGGNTAILCSLVPNGRDLTPLAVHLSSRGLFDLENKGQNTIVIYGHYAVFDNTDSVCHYERKHGSDQHHDTKTPREVSSDNESEEVNQTPLKPFEVKKKAKPTPRPVHIEKRPVAGPSRYRRNEDSDGEGGGQKAVGNGRRRFRSGWYIILFHGWCVRKHLNGLEANTVTLRSLLWSKLVQDVITKSWKDFVPVSRDIYASPEYTFENAIYGENSSEFVERCMLGIDSRYFHGLSNITGGDTMHAKKIWGTNKQNHKSDVIETGQESGDTITVGDALAEAKIFNVCPGI